MEASLTTLTVLYTSRLCGDLAALPRLYTLIKRIRAGTVADRIILLDLGEACAPGVWHCDCTEGRSMLIALDGMGYDAAYMDGYLTQAARDKLTALGEIVRMTLHTIARPFVCAGLEIAPSPHLPDGAVVSDRTRLLLPLGHPGDVYAVHLAREGQSWSLASTAAHHLTPDTLPDPTIAGMTEFIAAEARLAQKKRQGR